LSLKKIELFGFKSFADRLEINFEQGITCIVGPNGCGKSNITDAIRWVLGEQSPSVLRGKSMSEVIFAGTAAIQSASGTIRKAMSYSEVSLYFNNEDKGLDIDFNEVVITRKIYKSGESEYFINGNKCLLRNISDLFRDTGVGREGYSIIGQGQIDKILKDRPDDRREIFEEAAGINKYRKRKKDSEAKLQKTQDNMNRLADLLSMQEEQLEPMEKSAQTTRKVREMQERLRILDINSFLFQSGQSREQEEALRSEIESLTAECAGKKAEQEEIRKKFNVNNIDLINSDTLYTKLYEERVNLLLKGEQLSSENRVWKERLNRANETTEKAQAEYAKSSQLLKEKQALLEEYKKNFEEKNRMFIESGLELIKKEKQYKISEEEVIKEEQEVEKSAAVLNRMIESHADIKSSVVTLTGKRDMLLEAFGEDRQAISQYGQEYDNKQKLIAELENNLNLLKEERAGKLAQLTRSQKNLEQTKQDYASLEAKANQDARKEAELGSVIEMLTEQKKQMQGYQPPVRRLLSPSAPEGCKSRIAGVIGEIIKVGSDYQLAIEVALGAAVNNIVTNTSDDASFLIDVLRRERYGRATFLPLDNIRPRTLAHEAERALSEEGVIGLANELIDYESKFSNVIGNLLGNVVIVEDKKHGIKIAKKYKNLFRIVTLEGDHFATSGAITGGSAPPQDSQVLSQESRIKDLQERRKTFEAASVKYKAALEEIKGEIRELEKAIKVIEAQLHKQDIDIAAAEQNMDFEKQKLEQINEARNKLISKNQALAGQLSQLEAAIKAAGAKAGESISEKQDIDLYMQQARDSLIKKKRELASLRGEYEELKIVNGTLKAELNNLEDSIRRFSADASALEKRIADCEIEINMSERAAKEALNAIDKAVFSEQDREKLKELEKQTNSLTLHKDKLQKENERLDNERNALGEIINELSVKIAQKEGALERLISEFAILSERITEEYGLDYQTAEKYKDEKLLSKQSVAEAAKLRRAIERCGPINARAPEEYEQALAKYTEDKKQFDDMEKARQDTLTFLAELTKEMEEKFLESFEKINVNFDQTFKELFGGGQARLSLNRAGGVSVLDAGIDIDVAPPGKRLQGLSLLSGGEKALVAIAILFAIIKLKPAPFCVLDEIDTALDEANAELFGRYLRKFSEKTQFIVVTHKKPAMQYADRLYGVTMQEAGVSKIVGVKLEEAVKGINKHRVSA
jgi:chromosome segregation protein